MPNKLKLATWNINSVRARIVGATRYLKEHKPDVLCLQEIKCLENDFPYNAFRDAGYPHIQVRGQKGHHGVATVSRLPIEPLPEPDYCSKGEARVALCKVGGIELHNIYFPSGGDEPDPEINDKFAHKLVFWDRLTKAMKRAKKRTAAEPVVITGDFNIAPGEHDVHNHKRLLKYVGHSPGESELYFATLKATGFTDIVRQLIPEPEQIPTWWSYRVKSWSPESPGWRLDHYWLSPGLVDKAMKAGRKAVTISTETRTWEKPSDHVPVSLELNV
jgi:exodeoxyribonuclease-3